MSSPRVCCEVWRCVTLLLSQLLACQASLVEFLGTNLRRNPLTFLLFSSFCLNAATAAVNSGLAFSRKRVAILPLNTPPDPLSCLPAVAVADAVVCSLAAQPSSCGSTRSTTTSASPRSR